MKLFNTNAELTPIAKAIMSEDIAALDDAVKNGFKINQPLIMTERIRELPIELVLLEQKQKVLDWLLRKKVKLNDKNSPAMVSAAFHCDAATLKTLVAHGANVNTKDRVGKTAMSTALYSNRHDMIPVLIELGYDMAHDGKSLRQAVFKRQRKAIQIFLDLGVDVNFHQPDMVFPNNPSAVSVAASNQNDLQTVQLLIAHGADVTIADTDGDRPYHHALAQKNDALIELIKQLEPPQWHSVEWRLEQLAAYNMPPQLIEFLCGDDRTIQTPDSDCKWLALQHITLIKEMKWQRRQFLELMDEVDNYDFGLAWYPKKKCLAYVDYEHDEFTLMGSWEAFIADPSGELNKVFFG